MYSLAIYLYMLCANIASLFNKKAKLMMVGHRNTWKILREKIGDSGNKYIWFHVASLGEFEQGRPLMERIRREHPEKKILLTFFSPSGYEVRKDYKGADVVCYLPFDTPLNARKFLKLANVEMAFFIKYEFWRNYIDMLHRKGIKAYSVSSIFRPNQIFFKWYGFGYARVLHRFAHLFVQNQQSAELLKGLGVENVSIVGDTRFDRVIDIMEQSRQLPIIEAFAANSPFTLIAGSSWEPDEDIILKYLNCHPGMKLVLAPHVVNESHLKEIEGKVNVPCLRYSQAESEDVGNARCLIIDCYGLLSSIYRYGNLAYVGGGFGVGIHNVPEAAVYGVPVVIGPNNKKFMEAQALLGKGGCREIGSYADFDSLVSAYMADPAKLKRDGDAAAGYIRSNSGATGMIYDTVFATNNTNTRN